MVKLFTFVFPWLAVLAQGLPSQFSDAVIARIPSPTAIEFLPDGRILVASQTGSLRVVRDGELLAQPALQFPATQICSNSERGLLGVAAHPEFPSTPWIYLYYTFRGPGRDCSTRTETIPVNRVSRFIMNGDQLDPASEQVLIDNILSFNGNHNAGDLRFHRRGSRLPWDLYVSTGDGGCDYRGGNRCQATNAVARETNTLLGKILRIDEDGRVPPGNMWSGDGVVRCNLGNAQPGQRCAEVWATGLRNPFRFALRRRTSDTAELFIADVGQNQWEEINAVSLAGRDFGWNIREGKCLNGSATNCPPPPAELTDPVFAYNHNQAVPGTAVNACRSISGGDFLPPGIWPQRFGSYVFGDFVCGALFGLRTPEGQSPMAETLRTGVGGVTVMRFGPWANTQALYYGTYANGGELRRISYLPRLGLAGLNGDATLAAPDSIVSAFGTFDPGAELVLRSPDGSETVVTEVLYRSASQLNFVVPRVPVTGEIHDVFTRVRGSLIAYGQLRVERVAPGLFGVGVPGLGAAAAQTVLPGMAPQNAFECSAGNCTPLPIDVSSGNTYLVLYGTGFRNHGNLASVRVRFGNFLVPVEYAGPQPSTPGLDQINVRLPQELAGLGRLLIRVHVGDVLSNEQLIEIR